MIEFRCTYCGKSMRAVDDAGGSTGTCIACGRSVQVPQQLATPGLKMEPDPTLGADARVAREPAAPLPPGRFRLAEASCQLWRKGGLANQPMQYEVEHVGLDGMTLLYATKRRSGTIATAPRRPIWEVGDELEAALSVGAFPTPLRLLTEVVEIADRADGPGCRIELRLSVVQDETAKKLQMLVDHEDLRQRKSKGLFSSAT
jgi:hypothetical protein